MRVVNEHLQPSFRVIHPGNSLHNCIILTMGADAFGSIGCLVHSLALTLSSFFSRADLFSNPNVLYTAAAAVVVAAAVYSLADLFSQ